MNIWLSRDEYSKSVVLLTYPYPRKIMQFFYKFHFELLLKHLQIKVITAHSWPLLFFKNIAVIWETIVFPTDINSNDTLGNIILSWVETKIWRSYNETILNFFMNSSEFLTLKLLGKLSNSFVNHLMSEHLRLKH